MNKNIKGVTQWIARFLWPTFVVMGWWAVRVETDLTYRLLVAFLLLASILFAWWQRRLYLAAVSLVFIGVSSLLVYLQNAGPDGFNLIVSYIVLVYILSVACFASFSTYAFKVTEPYITVYLVGVVFMCLEMFWLLSNLSADPLIRALLVTGLFHLSFTMVALYSWGKLAKNNFRWYVIGGVIFFAIFLYQNPVWQY